MKNIFLLCIFLFLFLFVLTNKQIDETKVVSITQLVIESESEPSLELKGLCDNNVVINQTITNTTNVNQVRKNAPPMQVVFPELVKRISLR